MRLDKHSIQDINIVYRDINIVYRDINLNMRLDKHIHGYKHSTQGYSLNMGIDKHSKQGYKHNIQGYN